MNKIRLETSKPVVPVIYAYTTPEIARHNGWTKIGYTEQNAEDRIEQQVGTSDVKYQLEWQGNAMYDDGTGELFSDHDFHAYLQKSGVERGTRENAKGKTVNTEWFHIEPKPAKVKFNSFREDHGILKALGAVPYELRSEQEDAVSRTVDYYYAHEGGEYLWNAKPRFGKTLSVYDFCKRVNAVSVLIVTNRPAIANSWYADYERFLGEESGYKFVSNTDALKGKRYVLSREEYKSLSIEDLEKTRGYIEFISLQDLKGSKYFSPNGIDKLKYVTEIKWDVLVVDEAHEGVDTYKTDTAFDHIKRKFTLHLSGTPFKALANEKFSSDAIYNWTYADEQAAKRDWNPNAEAENPYANLPKLNLFTYQMSEIVKDEIKQGVDIEGENYEYAFDLNEFFATDERGAFRYSSSVDKFLDALTTQEKFPFSTPELRAEIKHSFWLLNRVNSAKALARKLEDHPVFKEYKVVLAAGDGRLDDQSETKKSYDKVVEAIAENEKTITLSVGQLTTGVTIPEWTAVLMLSNMQSPALYMQAAFRAQNPCLFREGGKSYRKENAYVFDFDPARTLIIFEQFANDLYSHTASGKGDSETRKENVKQLLNFFPVIGEDEAGEMIPLDAEKILLIPRKLKSTEVVKRGFMSNYLFQNISNVFGAPGVVGEILKQLTPFKEGKLKNTPDLSKEADALGVDEEGNITLTDEQIAEDVKSIFGNKVYQIENIAKTAEIIFHETPVDKAKQTLVDSFKTHVVDSIVESTEEAFKEDIKKSDKNGIKKILDEQAEKIVHQAVNDFYIAQNHLESEMQEALQAGADTKEVEKIFEEKKQKAHDDLISGLSSAASNFAETAQKEVTEIVEKKIKERQKESIQDSVRDRLRGFSRTIPSFLMAYGDDTVTLATFDEIIPDQVFVEVTSITLDQFRFLRDGGNYTDEETGEEKHYEGHLFDPIVFDDSVKEFLRLKKKLADYFDEKTIEDIFDYIPPQKTNQIYTPKNVVKKMVDMMEEENPGCFDEPDKTFIDLYMKSGLYITEIVKRLYQSPKMKELFPNDAERLRHIFEKQVYGLAPTEIIYNIAKNYILGFSEEIPIEKHNIRLGDALPHAKAGDLESWLDEVFGE